MPSPVSGYSNSGAGDEPPEPSDFVDGWFASRLGDGTHDPALIALIALHRRRDALTEPDLLQALTKYAEALGKAVEGETSAATAVREA